MTLIYKVACEIFLSFFLSFCLDLLSSLDFMDILVYLAENWLFSIVLFQGNKLTIFSFKSCLDKALNGTQSLEETDMPVYKWKGTLSIVSICENVYILAPQLQSLISQKVFDSLEILGHIFMSISARACTCSYLKWN